MTEKKTIIDTLYTDKGAYKVPEGYFAALNQRIMDNVQVNGKQKKAKFVAMPRFRYAVAACFAAIIMGGAATAYLHHADIEAQEMAAAKSKKDMRNIPTKHYADTQKDYNEQCMEYVMVDKDDMFAYLIDE